MYLLKQWVAGVAALLVFLPSTGFAAGIVLKNSMNSDIKAVFCVGNNGDKKPVVEGLAKKSSKTVSPAKFPEHDCTRIGVTMQNGMGWQYYYEPQPGSAKEIEFGMDAAGRNEKRKYPSMLLLAGFIMAFTALPTSAVAQGQPFASAEALLDAAAKQSAGIASLSADFVQEKTMPLIIWAQACSACCLALRGRVLPFRSLSFLLPVL